jgi:dihydrofolate reductase
MSKLAAGFSVSLDGFVAEENNDTTHVFAWYFAEPIDMKTVTVDQLELTPESKERQDELAQGIGAIISGRRTFDTAHAWGGKHPMGVPVVVLTHNTPAEWSGEDSPFTFVTEGVEQAVEVARQLAGGQAIGVTGPDVMRQCMKLGLLDEIGIDLVPVLLGKGVRMFEYIGIEPLHLEKISVKNGPGGVTHLNYRIKKDASA